MTTLLTISSCGGNDDEDNSNEPSITNNINKNIASGNLPKEITNLEFPKVKGGNSIVAVHYSDGTLNYSVEWDKDLKSNRWTCYRIDNSNNMQNVARFQASNGQAQYPADPDVPESWQVSNDPFWSSGYDHGHMCASQDRVNTYNANKQTFYLTNMMPQLNSFNSKIWSTMEARIRNFMKNASNTDTLYVVKGGTIDKAELVEENKVHGMIIPKYYFSVCLMKNSSGYKAIGFWFEHKPNSSTDLTPYIRNVDYIEEMTGLDFFCNLPDDIENHVESLPVENVKRAWGFN